MNRPVPEVPPAVREKARRLGRRGQEWLTGLPDLVAELERRWSLTAGAPLDRATSAYVLRVRTGDGRAAVLKLAVPDPDFPNTLRTLQRAEGQGYVSLLAHDAQRHALLLESLGAPLDQLGLPVPRQLGILCATLRRAWRVPPPEDAVAAEDALAAAEPEKARALAAMVERLWDGLGRPCSERVVDRALDCAGRRAAAFDPGRCVVVHGDPHPGNALRATVPRPGAETGFVFVDPDGFLDEPAYDLGVALRGWCAELLAGDAVRLARSYCSLLAERTGVDAGAVWEWGFLERVSTGLYLLDHGAEASARPYLDTAELLAAAEAPADG
ncbi:aminoglycoside phosphotransferase family protein [Streptomyces sp. NPDC050610]|uniref:aminoglycoside phosphotransferase family protein n=1 Tax=Streptomyces sp. NPDC050610 TaxID=3157097 RepID=UPI003440A55C